MPSPTTSPRRLPSRRALIRLAALAWGAFAPTLLAPSAASAADPKLPVERYKLANGLEVVLHKDDAVPLVYVSVWYHVASGDEVPGKSGFAHLFEHMMFQGSTHVGEDKHFDTLKQIGASEINGTTSTDRTNYYEQIPSNQLEAALWLESDRMGYMLPLLNEKSLANQREVVRNERRQRVDNVPYGKGRLVLHTALYGEGHPYRYTVIGRHEDLAAASLEDVRGFFKKWYVPSNATLLIAGDLDVAETKKLVDKWFGSFPASEKPARRDVPPTPIPSKKREIVRDGFAKLRRVHYAWHSPRDFGPQDPELSVLASVLGRSGTGRLYKILVHEKQWAQSVAVFQQGQLMSGIFHVQADLKPEADLAAVEAILDEELRKVTREPITERERARVITEIEASFIRGLETLQSRGEVLQMYNQAFGEPDSVTRHLDMYRSTKVDGIRAAAARFLDPNRRVEVITMPASAAPGAAAPNAAASVEGGR
jgi:predicted Zn-dependent peptidase